MSQCHNADYWVAIEAGVDQDQAFAWIIIENRHHQQSYSRSTSFTPPHGILDRLQQGLELGNVMSKKSGITNIKQQGGAVALLTKAKLTRAVVYQQAAILAWSSLVAPSPVSHRKVSRHRARILVSRSHSTNK